MTKKKRHYTMEFKMDAIRLAESGVKSIVDKEEDRARARSAWGKKTSPERGKPTTTRAV